MDSIFSIVRVALYVLGVLFHHADGFFHFSKHASDRFSIFSPSLLCNAINTYSVREEKARLWIFGFTATKLQVTRTFDVDAKHVVNLSLIKAY